MQQTSTTNGANNEHTVHMPDAPASDSEKNAFSEEVDVDEALEAYNSQQPPNTNDAFFESHQVDNELPTDEHFPNVSEYSDEDDSHELELQDDDDKPLISIANKRVLLIEDDDDTTEILKQNLQTLGITKVNVATNAEGALSLLATDREMFPDVVVLELALVGMDGIQFLAQLRAHKSKRLQNLPAVVITMLDSPSIFRRAARQKVGAFLRKPVSTEGLKKGIVAALRGDVVEQPFSQPKSWLDDVDEEELREKRNSIKAKAAAKAEKKGFWVWLLNLLVPWSGRI